MVADSQTEASVRNMGLNLTADGWRRRRSPRLSLGWGQFPGDSEKSR